MWVLLVALFIFAVIFGPFAVMWAANTLFGLEIGFTFLTWLAALVLLWALRGKLEFKWSR